jgi:HAD superfamily hydrolase (TIGR01459 family)
MTNQPIPPRIAGLSELLDTADALFVDVSGVIHDGVAAFPAACEALRRAREAGKPVLLVSNAPRPGPVVVKLLDSLGVPRDAYDGILTSGDLTRAHLAQEEWGWIHHIGPARDLPLFEGLALVFSDADEADLAVATGLVDDEVQTADDYVPVLETLYRHEVPLLCANPDILVERGHRLIPCAGALAQVYERMGGDVLYFGKPHQPVYEAAMARLSELAGRPLQSTRVLAIGDAVKTDLLGAARFGLSSYFVAGGIHAAEAGSANAIDMPALTGLFAASKVAPVAVTWRLRW